VERVAYSAPATTRLALTLLIHFALSPFHLGANKSARRPPSQKNGPRQKCKVNISERALVRRRNKQRAPKKAPANQIMHEAIFYCALTHSTSALPSIYCAALQFIEPAAAATSVPKPRGARSPPTRKAPAAAAAALLSKILSFYLCMCARLIHNETSRLWSSGSGCTLAILPAARAPSE